MQIDDEITRWSRDSVEGRKFTKSCDKVEAKHTTASLFHGAPALRDEEEQEQDDCNPQSSSVTDSQRAGATRGRGGTRGRGLQNRNPNQPRGVTQSKDAEGHNQYQQGQDGKILLNERGHPRCNYCGIPSHRRDTCRTRHKDVLEGIKRPHHPNRGNLQSNNQQRRSTLSKDPDPSTPWANRVNASTHPLPQQALSPMAQWNDFLTPTPQRLTQFAIGNENQQWLANVTSAGYNPNNIITTARQAFQNRQHQSQQPSRSGLVISTNSSASLLPSGLFGCNECGVVSATMELADTHSATTHSSSAIALRQLSLTAGSGRQT